MVNCDNDNIHREHIEHKRFLHSTYISHIALHLALPGPNLGQPAQAQAITQVHYTLLYQRQFDYRFDYVVLIAIILIAPF
jgi:hypothetical protein